MRGLALGTFMAVTAQLVFVCARGADAAVVVIANRASDTVRVKLTPANSEPFVVSLEAGALKPVRVTAPIAASFRSGGKTSEYKLLPNSVSFFHDHPRGGVDLHEITFRSSAEGEDALDPSLTDDEVKTIPVKIFVDDDQVLVRSIWEPELRERIAECSEILEQHCFIKLTVVGVEFWDSDDATTDFSEALREFEREANPRPAELAIGFTSQFAITRGRTNLGGIHTPFSRHILIREWSNRVSPSGRLELLVHEIGHYFGAAHSPEQSSVMRPILADKQSNAVGFRIGYDPVNTLIMNIVAEEYRVRHVRAFHALSNSAKATLRPMYAEIGRALPKDPAAARFITLLGPPTRANVTATKPTQPPHRTTPANPTAPKATASIDLPPAAPVETLPEAARRVVAAISTAARENQQIAQGSPRLSGDQLTEWYFQRAAAAAATLPSEYANAAFLLGAGVALDSTDTLSENPWTAPIIKQLESATERERRVAVLGRPTMHGRADLLAHFVISSALTAAVGPKIAESAGVLKELNDSRDGGSGFSFVDLSADYAGIAFAESFKQGRQDRFKDWSMSFRIDDFLPTGDDLPEGLSSGEFVGQYGSPGDERFEVMKQEIHRRIRALPGHAAAPESTP